MQRRIFWALLAVFAALQSLDVLTTMHILANGGRELNPLAAPLIASYGVDALWLQKAAALAVVGGLMYLLHRASASRGYPRAPAIAWLLLLPFAAYPALHNVEVLR